MEVPIRLAELKHWVLWKYEDGTIKVPVDALSGHGAKSNDPSTWCELSLAQQQLAAAPVGMFAGLGFMLGAGVVGIDLDGCRNPASGVIAEWAAKIIERFATYAEVSPSGSGIKLFGLGKSPLPSGKSRKLKQHEPLGDKLPGVEVYDAKRYFAFTGQRINEHDVTECQAALDELCRQVWPEFFVVAQPAANHVARPSGWGPEERAAKYLEKLPPAIAGQHGHNRTFRAACILVIGFGLSPERAMPILQAWNAGCQPVWEDKDLWHKLQDADKREGERGWMLVDSGRYEGPDIDLRSLLASLSGVEAGEPVETPPDVGSFPVECLRVPGLIGEVMAHNLATAIFPQPELALASAVALMATITGGKVVDRFGTRPNLYVLGLAPSGGGKDHGRKINRELLTLAGAMDLIGAERIASHAGLVVAVHDHPVCLFQIDEIARLLSTMQDAKRSPHLYNIASVLMQLYTSSGSIWTGDAYADSKKTRTIKYPHCVVYGTAVPEGFWQSLSADNMSDGLLGRFCVFESRGYVMPQEHSQQTMPESLVARVKKWLTFSTVEGNLGLTHAAQAARPLIVPHDEDSYERAMSHLNEICRRRCTETPVEAALWSRTAEKTNKLALIFACSRAEQCSEAVIELDDVERAIKVSNWLTRKMLAQAGLYVSANEHEATVKKVIRIIREHGPLTKHQLSRKTQWMKKRDRDEILAHLLDGMYVAVEERETGGRPETVIRSM